MINPYNYLFYLLFLFLDKRVNYKENIVLGINSILFLILFLHFFASMMFLPEIKFITDSNIANYKWIFGAVIAFSFVLNNYILFEKKERYKIIIDKIQNAKKQKKSITICFLILYFSFPFIVLFYNHLC